MPRDWSKKINGNQTVTFNRKDGRTVTMQGGVIIAIDGKATQAAQPTAQVDLKRATGKLPVVLLPNGDLAVVTRVTGLHVQTDLGNFDVEKLAERHSHEHPVKFGEMLPSDIQRYRHDQARQSNQPAGRSADADVDAGPAYSLLRAGLLDSLEVRRMLGVEKGGDLPFTAEARLPGMGFPAAAVEEFRRLRRNKSPLGNPKPPPPPVVPKHAKDRKRRIDYIDKEKP